jgi:1-acyl-sn-glycerol-3-phosphate acyltransferase
MFERAVAGLITGGAQLLTGVQARWIGCGPEAAQRIYFANHTSHVDFILLCSALPAPLRAKTRPVAASDYWNRGAVRRYLARRVFRGVLVDRGFLDRTASPIAPIVDALDRGDSLILFPEGTRGHGEDLLPFKSGIYHVAQARPGVELVPVWMDNSYRVMPKGAIFPLPMLCSVAFGKPTQLGADESMAAFLARLRQSVIDLGAR